MNDFLQTLLAEHAYTTVMAVLILCGVGLPLPEEVPLIGGGWAVHNLQAGVPGLWLMILAATLAILVGDSVTFWLGRMFGPEILKVRWVQRMITPRRVHKAHLAFEKHGWKAVFFARFLAGVRLGTYFIAGTLRMRWSMFLFLDFLGCLISVPVSVWLGWHFGEQLERAFAMASRFQEGIIAIVVLAALFYLGYVLWRRRTMEKVPVEVLIDEVRATPLKPPRQRARDDSERRDSGEES